LALAEELAEGAGSEQALRTASFFQKQKMYDNISH